MKDWTQMNVIERLREMIVGLQQLIALLEKHPELQRGLYPYGICFVNWIYGEPKEKKINFSKGARKLAAGLKNKLEKKYTEYDCSVQREFAGKIRLQVAVSREVVCERIVTGTKTIEEQIIPAREEEIVEWRCK